jgi:hypothetical protein
VAVGVAAGAIAVVAAEAEAVAIVEAAGGVAGKTRSTKIITLFLFSSSPDVLHHATGYRWHGVVAVAGIPLTGY